MSTVSLSSLLVTVFALLTGSLVQDYEKLAPFTGVRFDGDVPHVQVEGEWWVLEAVDGIAAAELVDLAKRNHRSNWQKRIGEDLVQVLSEHGKPPGRTVRLDLVAEQGGAKRVIEQAPMTAANRRAVWSANRAVSGIAPPPAPDQPVAKDAAKADARLLAELMEQSYSYFKKPGVDAAAARTALERAIDSASDPLPRADFALLVMRYLASFGDGHTRLSDPPEAFLPEPYLPCLLEDAGGRVVAFRADRSDFVDAKRPYLVAIDSVPIDRWIEAAGAIAAKGAPHAARRDALRNLRLLGFARRELKLADSSEVELELEGEKRGDREKKKVRVSGKKPSYGSWPRQESGRIGKKDDVGYLRIERMDDEPAFLEAIDRTLAELRDCKRLVIDVRDNGGGSRDLTAKLVPLLMPKNAPPRIVNVAAKRLDPGEGANSAEGLLSNRRLYPKGSREFDDADRKAIDAVIAKFEPEWKLPKGEFSDWHFFVLKRDAERALDGIQVVVLMNGGCFSATDIFLGALKGLPGVTLLGTTSGGGSGRARGFELPNSKLGAQCSSMASFRPDGKLYDGRGVEPDVVVPPIATDFIGKTDTQLDAALSRLAK